MQGLRNEVKNTLGYNTQQCLVVANGRILKESSQQLSSYGLVDGNTVAFVNASKRRKHITDDIPVCLGTLSYTSKADEKPEKVCFLIPVFEIKIRYAPPYAKSLAEKTQNTVLVITSL